MPSLPNLHSLRARLRSLWRGLRRPDRLSQEMDEEMRFHVAMEAERLMRARGLSAADAERQARIAFGSMDRYQEEGRDVRGLTRMRGLSLDVKLGARLLGKYPAVTIVGGVAMAIGIALGAGYLEVVNDVVRPTLPLDEGDRIVGVQNWDVAESDPELRSLHDYVVWREELESIEQLGAFRTVVRNLGIGSGPQEPADGAEITPSAFQLARVPALLGRTLLPSDERVNAPAVVVLGYDLWRGRFGGDPDIIGRAARLGTSMATVVGVMPEGFTFPVSQEFWIPLRPEALAYARRAGPAILMFGRLAPGASVQEAQTELSALGLRAAADYPDTHEGLRPRVVRYTELFIETGGGGTAYLVEILFVLLLVVLSSNVATMVFARTAAREHEVAMRFALGASRQRILGQFFVEALVLALGAAAVGLAFAAWGTGHVARMAWQVTEGEVPFWLDSGLSLTTVLYALLLAVVAALVAGVMPALKATRRRLQEKLRHPGGAGDSGLRFGGLWSGVIVVQIAFAVLILPPALVAFSSLFAPQRADAGFATEEYLSARIESDLARPPADSAERAALFAQFETANTELRRRLLAQPEISRVTFATRLPGMDHSDAWMEVDTAGGAALTTSRWVMTSAVDAEYFDAFEAEIVAGRPFNSSDVASDARVVIVNDEFVDEFLGGRNALGRRVRANGREPGPWYEIVGVVAGLGMDTDIDPFHPGAGPGVYFPLRPGSMAAGDSWSVRVAFHVRGDAAAFAPRLRELAHAAHPALRLHDVLPLDRPIDSANRGQRIVTRFFSWTTGLVGLVAILISAAGTYSVLSFTVARQTREIGIRIALGADARRIVAGVFSRAIVQIGIGILVGASMWLYVFVVAIGQDLWLLLASALVLLVVGMAACGVPVRRALRIQPTEALREIG